MRRARRGRAAAPRVRSSRARAHARERVPFSRMRSPDRSTGTSRSRARAQYLLVQSQHGSAIAAPGLGSQMEIDPELVVAAPTLSIGRRRMAQWANSTSSIYEEVTRAIAERYGVDRDAGRGGSCTKERGPVPGRTTGEPVQGLPQTARAPALPRPRGSRGIVSNNSRRSYREDGTRVDAREDRGVHVEPRVPLCGFVACGRTSPRVLVGGTR